MVQTSDCASLLKQNFSSLLVEADSIRVQGKLGKVLKMPLLSFCYTGLEITANRLFGPQPRTSTYICIWSIYLGSMVGSIPPVFLQALTRSMSALAVNFTDQDNSLPSDFTVALEPDATFVTVDLGAIDIAIRGLGTAIQLDIEEGVRIRYDDLPTRPFLKHISIEMPSLVIRFLAPLFGRAAPWMEVASLDADFSIVLGLSEDGWEGKAKRQLEYIAAQDGITKRCPFLYGGGEGGMLFSHAIYQDVTDIIALVSSHVGSLFLPALPSPKNRGESFFVHNILILMLINSCSDNNNCAREEEDLPSRSASSSSEYIDTEVSDTSSESSFSDDSDSSEGE